MFSRRRSSSLATLLTLLLCFALLASAFAPVTRRSEEFVLDWSRPATQTKASGGSDEGLGKILVLLSLQ